MKPRHLFILLYVLFGRVGFSQENHFKDDELLIYKYLINKVQLTVDSMNINSSPYFYEIEIEKNTVNEFNYVVAHHNIIDKNFYNEVNVKLLTELQKTNVINSPIPIDEIKSNKGKKVDPKLLKKVHVEFSRVGFYENQALIYFGVQYTYLNGYGFLYLMQKDNNEWHIIKRYTKWAA